MSVVQRLDLRPGLTSIEVKVVFEVGEVAYQLCDTPHVPAKSDNQVNTIINVIVDAPSKQKPGAEDQPKYHILGSRLVYLDVDHRSRFRSHR